jgi:hypothetical protein
MSEMQSGTPNPLKKYFRQPKIYIPLPSKGNFYPQGALDKTENGQYPVYPMTARDEIMMKTPDALVNGETTVQVIQSCMPNIKDAWKIPVIDLDVILIAIRLATYGETMDIELETPVTKEKKSYELNLSGMLDQLSTVNYNNQVQIDEFKVFIKPLTYQEFTKTTLKTYEEQKIFKTLNNINLSEEEKLVTFNDSFKKLTDLAIVTLEHSILRIETDEFSVTDQNHIKEFVDNSDKDFFKKVLNHIEAEKDKFTIQPLKVESTKEEIEAGVPASYEIPITFDQSNFFV